MQGVAAFPPQLIVLQDGRTAVLRPAGKSDITEIRAYIERLSNDDRHTRYMGTVSVHMLTSPQRLAHLYDETLDYRAHAAFIVVLGDEIIGVAHAFRIGEGTTYEVSFSRRSDLIGKGVGIHLMHVLIDWGVKAGATDFHAATFRTRNPHMRALFDQFGFVAKPDPEDFEVVNYSARVADLELVRAAELVD
jgi:RimJ/RimL family protein N-acetyltransferase